MKYLIDNQLPTALSRYLRTKGLESCHVAELAMDQATDREIWQHATSNGFAIVSKDEDFLHLSGADPGGPPFIWVRLGNCRKSELLAALTACCHSFFRRSPRGIRS
jgi:predicted nuclease of predicted toxin-antitoxin system